MIKRIFRAVLISLALVLTLAGSLNLNRADADIQPLCDACGEPGPYFCTGAGGKRCSGYWDP